MKYKQAYDKALSVGWQVFKHAPDNIDRLAAAQKAFEAVMAAYGYTNQQGEFTPCSK